MMNAGIFGVGSFLPKTVRTNKWWSDAAVACWDQRKTNKVMEGAPNSEAHSAGALRVIDAMSAYRNDPFRGAVERRVIDDDKKSSDLEVCAGLAALADANVDASEIDLLIVYSTVPDFLTTPNAALVHEKLGLRRACFSLQVDMACNSFMSQIEIANAMIRSGQAKRALLIQSSAFSRTLMPEDASSPWVGDGAGAIVMGPVTDGFGFLSIASRTDGSVHQAAGTTIPGKNWYDEGRNYSYSIDPKAGRKLILSAADAAKDVFDEVFHNASLAPSDVDFYACHQASVWFRRVTQDFVGMQQAKSLDTFSFAGNLLGGNIPLVLSLAKKERMLNAGDLVAFYAGGAGMTWSAALARWGNG